MEGTAGAEAATNELQKGVELVKVCKAMEGQEVLAPPEWQSSWQAGYKYQAVGGSKVISLSAHFRHLIDRGGRWPSEGLVRVWTHPLHSSA